VRVVTEWDFELHRIHVAYIRGSDGTLRPAFVIDGRTYGDEQAMKRDLDEAWDVLRRRRLVAEFETRPAEGEEQLAWLPSWPEYRDDTLGADSG
jgi:hypothetical protein